MTDERAAKLRFYGVGALAAGGLIASISFRIWAVIPADRWVALGYLAVALGAGALYLRGARSKDSSDWRQDPEEPGNRRWWKLVLAAVLVPLLDEALLGGLLILVAGFVLALLGGTLIATYREAAEARVEKDHPGPNG